MSEDAAYLGVARSVSGRRWIGPGAAEERAGLAVAQGAELPEIVGRVLAARGVAPEEAASYLDPRLRDLMPDPSALADMDRAAARLAQAARRGERVAVFADYDVDGAASAALLTRWLRALGRAPTVYVPDRIEEGYGPNAPAMRRLGAAHDLVICVDCGVAAPEPVAAATAEGADVLVADHHLCPDVLPPAMALVNPNRPDDAAGLGYLCAAGVVFMLLAAAGRALREEGARAPDLMGMLDLVALATVADVAPLVGLNRALVRQGLKVLAQRRGAGLRALADIARMSGPPSAHHLGFLLGPRVNAGGRVGAADLGARLLSTEDPHEAAALAERLDALNAERRAIEAEVLEAAAAQIAARGAGGPLVWAAGEGWHPGVVGVVASRLKERFDRPAVVIGLAGGEGKGSGRSVEGVDLGGAVSRLAAEGALLKGGGHRMAAGLSVAEDRLEPAMERLGALLARQGAGVRGPADLRMDGVLAAGGADLALCALLEAAGPWGAAAPAPRFALAGVRLTGVRASGDRHLFARAGDATGSVDLTGFGLRGGPVGEAVETAGEARLHIAGRLEVDDWRGRRRARLRLEDAAPADAS